MKTICPSCSAELEGDISAGEIVDCPSCGNTFEAQPALVVSKPAPKKPIEVPPPELHGLAVKAFILHIGGSRYGWKAEDEISKARGAVSTGDMAAAKQHAETARDMIRHGCLSWLLLLGFIIIGIVGFVYALVIFKS